MSDPMTMNAVEAANQAANKLVEHFDGVIILGSATDDDGNTVYVREWRGNQHAIEGAVREWLRKHENYDAGYHAEIGRHDAEQHRRNREARERDERDEGDDWKAG